MGYEADAIASVSTFKANSYLTPIYRCKNCVITTSHVGDLPFVTDWDKPNPAISQFKQDKKLLLNFVIQERTHLNTIFIQFVTYDLNYLFFIQNTRFHNKEREKKKKD